MELFTVVLRYSWYGYRVWKSVIWERCDQKAYGAAKAYDLKRTALNTTIDLCLL